MSTALLSGLIILVLLVIMLIAGGTYLQLPLEFPPLRNPACYGYQCSRF